MKKCILALLAIFACSVAVCAQSGQLTKAEYQELRVRAEKENEAEAQYTLGNHFYQGNVPGFNSEDSRKGAARYWAMAYKNNHPEATGNLGYAYRFGVGVDVDTVRAQNLYIRSIELGNSELVELLDRAAQNGSAFDAIVLYNCYAEGKGVVKNEAKAVEYLKIAANAGDTQANRRLAQMLYKSNDYDGAREALAKITDRNQEERYRLAMLNIDKDNNALDSLETLACEAYIPAMESLADLYYSGSDRVSPNHETAAIWYRRAAGMGSHKAAWTLVDLLVKGDGVPADYDQAIYFIDFAVPFGYIGSLREKVNGEWRELPFFDYFVGVCYAKTGNYDKAAEYLKKAKKAKVPGAETQIALLDLYRGDATKAYKSLAKLAKKQDGTAFYPVCRMLLDGQGVQKDTDQALQYALSSVGEGNPFAMCIAGDIYMSKVQQGDAVEMYTAAENLGILTDSARANYSKCLRRGLGCTADEVHANKLDKFRSPDRLVDPYKVTIQEVEK